MKAIIGVEKYTLEEDFIEAIAKLKEIMDKGDEADIVYISGDDDLCYQVLVKGIFEIKDRYPLNPIFEPKVMYNTELIQKLNLSI